MVQPTITQAMRFDVLRQMTPYPIVIEELDEPDVIDADAVSASTDALKYPHTATVGDRPQLWSGSMRISTNKDPRSPDFLRFIPRGAVLTTQARVEDFFVRAARHAPRIEGEAVAAEQRPPSRGFHPSMIYAGEWDVYKKLTIQIGRRWDGYLGRLGPSEDITLPGRIWDMAQRLARWYRRRLTELGYILPTTDPYDTNSGWPLFSKGPIPKLVGACFAPAGGYRDDVVEASTRFASRYGLPMASIQAFGLGYRSGPLYKAAPDYNYVGNGKWVATRTVKGAWPRARHIFMGPFTNFRMLRPLWQAFMAVHKATLGLAHTGTEDDDAIAQAYRDGKYMVEADFSGFDQNVPPAWRDVIKSIIRSVVGARLSELFEYWQSAPVISPSWFAAPDGVTIVASNSGVHSGSKDTSVYGTLCNLVSSLSALEVLGVCKDAITEVLDRHETMLFVLGDDTLIASDVPVDPAAWTATMAEVGFKATTLPGCRFLMQHRTPMGPRQVGARVIQNTISPEYPPVGRHAIGMNAVGFLGRTEKGIPVEMDDIVKDVLSSAEWLEPIIKRSRTIADTRAIISSEMGHLMHAALESKAAENYVTRIWRDAPHSPGARQQLMWMQQFAPDLVEEPERFKREFENTATMVTQASSSFRADLAESTADALSFARATNQEIPDWVGVAAIRDAVTYSKLPNWRDLMITPEERQSA